MSTIFCVSGRLKMATIHGGSSKIATICEREGKEKKTEKKRITKTTPVIVEYCSALCCQNLMKVECQKILLAGGWSQSQSKQIMGCWVVQKSTARCGYHWKQMFISRNPSQKVIESVLQVQRFSINIKIQEVIHILGNTLIHILIHLIRVN